MSNKKDFSQINTGRVYNQMAEAIEEPKTQEVQHPRKPYDAEQVQKMREAGTTRGRKGCKAIRINMAFPPDLHEYIRVMARLRGQSITEFTNDVFRHSMEANAELYAQAKEFQKSFK